MCNRFFLTICGALLAATLATSVDRATAAENGEAHAKQLELIRILESEAPKSDKALACKQLAVYADADAVPALGQLLSDRELASWARIALEAIPDPAVDEVLREATGRLSGRLLIGAINSIGVRRDPQAVVDLARRLVDADAEVASAAAVALGRIGNGRAAKKLRAALIDTRPSVRSAVAEGCILCAERFFDDGKLKRAAKLYNGVREADVPKQRIIEATRGVILSRQTKGIPLLIKQLRSDDQRFVAIGLSTARELPGPEVTAALVAELQTAAAARQAQLLFAVADRQDATALPALLESAANGPDEVRIAAVQALRRVGDASCLPVLLEVATGAEPQLREETMITLAGLADDEVDRRLVAHLSEAKRPLRQTLIDLAGRRRVAAANAFLLKAVNESDAQIRAAALTALGATAQPDHLTVLISRVLSPDFPEDREVALQAIQEASVRMLDREACADLLAAAIPTASPEAQIALLTTLGTMGGPRALEAIATSAAGDRPELQDAATQVLGEWMTADAAPLLLELAEGPLEPRYQRRALRGYIRIARQFELSTEQRAEMCRAALQAAKRDDEKKLILEVLQRYPCAEMLQIAKAAAEDAQIKEAAQETLQAIRHSLNGQ